MGNERELEHAQESGAANTNTKLIEDALTDPKTALKIVRDNFNSIDTDKDGFLKFEELRTSELKEPTNSSKREAIHLARNYLNQLKDLSNDEWFSEKKGASKLDLEAFDKLDRKTPLVQEYQRAVDSYGKLMKNDVTNYAFIAKELKAGNALPLGIAMDAQSSYEDRRRMFSGVDNALGEDKGSLRHAVTWRNRGGGDLYFRTVQESGSMWKSNTTLYSESYCPHYMTRYGGTFRVLQK